MEEMVSASEQSLRRLGFKFVKNGGENNVELDVTWPEPFLVRITRLAEVEYPSAMFGMLSPKTLPECTDVRILVSEDAALSRERSAEFVWGVLEGLKRPPWKGLGFIRSGTSKEMWSRAAEGRE